MNEIKVSVSRGTGPGQQRLPLFRLNRRFIVCCALCVATLQLALAEIPPAKRRDVQAPAALPLVTIAPSTLRPVVTRESVLTKSAAWQMIEHQRKKNADDRWEKFETEYGIDGKRRIGVLGSVQLAKYTLDEMTFTVDDFTRSLSAALKLEYDHGRVHRATTFGDNGHRSFPNPWSEMPRGVRFGPELNLDGGKPYVGLVVVVPFGN
jgi:hypothetical protein